MNQHGGSESLRVLDTMRGANFALTESFTQIPSGCRDQCRLELVGEDKPKVIIIVGPGNHPMTTVAVQSNAPTTDSGEKESHLQHGSKVFDAVSVRSFLAMRAAYAEFERQRQHADVRSYSIKVVSESNNLIVIFAPETSNPRDRGNTATLPGYEVQLDPASLQVKRANFVR